MSVNAYGVTIDLNGHSLTNTKDGAVGLEIYPKYSTKPGNQTTVTIRNSGTKTAVIQASTPLKTKSGNSQIDLPILLGENVQLQPTGTGAALSMEGSSYINYTPANAAYVKNGGFKSTHADGKDYIHGSFSAAAKTTKTKPLFC